MTRALFLRTRWCSRSGRVDGKFVHVQSICSLARAHHLESLCVNPPPRAYIQVGDRLCDSKKNGRRSSVLKWGRAVYGGVEHRKHWEQCKGERDVFFRIK